MLGYIVLVGALVSAAYPAASVLLAAAFLSEPVTIGRLAGLGLVIGGVVVMTLAA